MQPPKLAQQVPLTQCPPAGQSASPFWHARRAQAGAAPLESQAKRSGQSASAEHGLPAQCPAALQVSPSRQPAVPPQRGTHSGPPEQGGHWS